MVGKTKEQVTISKFKEDLKMGIDSVGRHRGLDMARQRLAVFDELLSKADSADHDLGNILATSGYSVAPSGYVLDWGLVHARVREGRARPNLVGSHYIPLLLQPSQVLTID